jgi:hypothetical protein
MKPQFAIVLLLVVLLSSEMGQTSTSPETFSGFWKTFKAAVARNDREAVADLTRLPFLYESKERDLSGFVKIYNQLFTRKIRSCIATTKPKKEGENYDVFCGELIFYFGKDADGKYKFLEFGVND